MTNTKSLMVVDNSGSADMTNFSDLSHDLIFRNILLKMPPSKAAIQLSFFLSQQCLNEEDVVSSSSVLDLDEDDDGFARHNDPHQHDRFVKFLEGYLEYYCGKGDHPLDTLRLNMRLKKSGDVSILSRWLELAFEKGVKALDIRRPPTGKPDCRLSWLTTFANAKFLTSLKLDCVKFTSFGYKWNGTHGPPPILPTLKTLSLKGLSRLRNADLLLLLITCPSLEYLSLTDCSFKYSYFEIPTLFLKSMNFMSCEADLSDGSIFVNFDQSQADIIESFTWIGVRNYKLSQCFSWLTCIGARKSLTCLNLQSVNIVDFQYSLTFVTQIDEPLFSSLKTMTFTDIGKVDDENFFSILLEGCPFLEHLSLTECCVKKLIMKSHVSSSSLKSLEIKQCSQLRLVQIDEAKNLESFTFVWLPQPNPKSKVKSICKSKNRKGFTKVMLDNSFVKLKNINICVNGFVEFSLNGCQPVRSHLDLTDSLHKIAPSALIHIEIAAGKEAS